MVRIATIRFLGAGSAFTPRFGTTCALLRLDEQRWLIDCGRQAPEQLKAAGLSWHELEGQLVTHVHGDHVYGLEEFALTRFYRSSSGCAAVVKGGPRPGLVAHSAVRGELWEVLGPSLRYRTDQFGRPAAGRLEDYFEPISPSSAEPPSEDPWPRSESFPLGPVLAVARETRHVPGKPCTGFELQLGPGSPTVWWSGDSVLNPELLLTQAGGPDLVFHDCTWTTFPGQVHAPFSELAQLPPSVRCRMVLMHHDDDVLEHRAEVERLGFRLALPGDEYDLFRGSCRRCPA